MPQSVSHEQSIQRTFSIDKSRTLRENIVPGYVILSRFKIDLFNVEHPAHEVYSVSVLYIL